MVTAMWVTGPDGRRLQAASRRTMEIMQMTVAGGRIEKKIGFSSAKKTRRLRAPMRSANELN
jgi:hypothetical protein